MTSKNSIDDLNKGDKLNDDNYNTLHHEIQYVLEEYDVLMQCKTKVWVKLSTPKRLENFSVMGKERFYCSCSLGMFYSG